MRKGRNSGIFIVIVTLLLWSGCSTEEQLFENPAYVQAAFRLNALPPTDGKIAIQEAYLKLDRLQAVGNGDTHTNITHPIPAEDLPFQLSKRDSSQITFRLPGRAYQVLDFHLFFLPDQYQLVFKEPLAPEQPDGVGDPGDDNAGEDVESPAGGDTDDDETPPAEPAGGDNDDDKDDAGDGSADNGDGLSDDDHDEDQDQEDNPKQKDKKKDKKKKGDNKDRDDDDKDDDDKDDDGRKVSGETNPVLDLDHFFQHAKPGLLVTGAFTYNGQTIHVIFVSSGLDKITVRAKQDDGSPIRLSDYNEAEITFDADVWFQAINAEAIGSATLQTYQQQTVLFIHKDFNSHLYERLAPGLEGATSLTIVPKEGGIF